MVNRILFAGNSEQNILYAGQVLIEAAADAGWHAICVDSGCQAGVEHCVIMLGREPLRRESKELPNVGVLASLAAADVFERSIRPGGLLVLNAAQIRRPVLRRDADVFMVPVAITPEDPALATMTLLGALISITGWISVESALAVVRKSCMGDRVCAAFRSGAAFVDQMLVGASSKAA